MVYISGPGVFKAGLLMVLMLIVMSPVTGGEAPTTGVDELQLVAIQMTLDPADYVSQQRFESRIKGILEQVDDRLEADTPALVVFPEDIGLLLVGQGYEEILTGTETMEVAIRRLTLNNLLPVVYNRLRHRISWVPALYYHRSREIAETYFDTFGKLAREYEMYIVGGSVILPHYPIKEGKVLYQQSPLGPEIYNSSYLFGPGGRVLGFQDKVNLLELEGHGALHLTPGQPEEIEVVETAIGRLGIAICLDGFAGNVVSRLEEQGAEVLIQPSANPRPWSRKQQEEWLAGSYRYTHQLKYFEYAVNPMLNGRLMDLEFAGQSGIITASPEEGSPRQNYRDLEPVPGFLEIARSDRKQEILVTKVSIE
ncbi:MAG: nitrilase-related carbon-nitrogen hydrolase [Bacillota bacterium]